MRIEAAEESDQVNRENNFLNLLLKHIFQGKYECVATNSVGTEYSYSAQLYVRGKDKSFLISYTVFENHRKSLIQHFERSELCLHFEWPKVN